MKRKGELLEGAPGRPSFDDDNRVILEEDIRLRFNQGQLEVKVACTVVENGVWSTEDRWVPVPSVVPGPPA